MPVTNTGTPEIGQKASAIDRVADVARHAAHLSHEARLVTSIAKDVGEDSVHAAKRVIKRVKRGVETLEDFKDEAAHAVKRQPFKTVGIAAGVGLLVGVVVGWIGGRCGARPSSKS